MTQATRFFSSFACSSSSKKKIERRSRQLLPSFLSLSPEQRSRDATERATENGRTIKASVWRDGIKATREGGEKKKNTLY